MFRTTRINKFTLFLVPKFHSLDDGVTRNPGYALLLLAGTCTAVHLRLMPSHWGILALTTQGYFNTAYVLCMYKPYVMCGTISCEKQPYSPCVRTILDLLNCSVFPYENALCYLDFVLDRIVLFTYWSTFPFLASIYSYPTRHRTSSPRTPLLAKY